MKYNKLRKIMLVLSTVAVMGMAVPAPLTATASEIAGPASSEMLLMEETENGEAEESEASESEYESEASEAGSSEEASSESEAASESEAGSETAEPSESETTEPSESENTEPSEAENTEPSESENTEPSESETTEPSESETTEPSESETTEPSESETTEPSNPDDAEIDPIVLVIDPGHDSKHGSSVITYNNVKYYEDKMNLTIALYLAEELCTYKNVKVVMTRSTAACPIISGATTDCLSRRYEIGGLYNADALISVHLNAGGGKGANVLVPNSGYATNAVNSKVPAGRNLYTEGQNLGNKILDKLCALGLTRRGLTVRDADTSRYPDRSKSDYYAIVRGSKVQGILGIIIEHGFLDNATEFNKFMSSNSKLKALGVADATAIAEYYGLKKDTKKHSYITVPAAQAGTVPPTPGNTEPAAPITTPEQVVSSIYQVAVSTLNVRSGPGTSYSKLGVLARDSKVTVVGIQGDWGRIVYNGKNGWIALPYCKKIKDNPPPGEMKKADDGCWYYYRDGKVDTSFTGMAKNAYGWWYLSNGKLDLTFTGMAKNDYGWWYMTRGKLDQTYTGMAKNDYGWWYMTKGKLDLTYTGMAKNDYGWWYMTKGELDRTYTGVAKNPYGYWYIKAGKLDLTFTGNAKDIKGYNYKVVKGKATRI